jgi:hypothetical protein
MSWKCRETISSSSLVTAVSIMQMLESSSYTCTTHRGGETSSVSGESISNSAPIQQRGGESGESIGNGTARRAFVCTLVGR